MQTCFLRALDTNRSRGQHAPFRTLGSNGTEVHCDFAESGIGAGAMQTLSTQDFVVTIADGRLNRQIAHDCAVETDLLLVRAAVSSDCGYLPDDVTPWRFRHPAVTVSTLPKGTKLGIRIDTGAPQRVITILMQPLTLPERYGIQPAMLPKPWREAIATPMTAPRTLAALPIDADIGTLVNDVVHSRLTGSFRRMQAQARAIELLALTAASWNGRLAADDWPGARMRDGDIVASARRILSEHFTDPPTLQALATRVGTNKNKLNRLFQQRLGVTPQTFCLHRRIERAQALIAEGRLSVGQIADAVGYQHQSSFAVAFREVVGCSPREFGRLQCLPSMVRRSIGIH